MTNQDKATAGLLGRYAAVGLHLERYEQTETTLSVDILLGGPSGRTISRTRCEWDAGRQEWAAVSSELLQRTGGVA